MVHSNYRFERLSYDGCTAHSTLIATIIFVTIGVFVISVALFIHLASATKTMVNKQQEKRKADTLLYS